MVSRCSNEVCNATLILLNFDFFGDGLVPEIACNKTVSRKPFSSQIAVISFQREGCLHCREPWNAQCHASTLLTVEMKCCVVLWRFITTKVL